MKIRDRHYELEPYEECPCGSRKKFKFCCFKKAKEAVRNTKNHSNNYTVDRIRNMATNFWKETDFELCFVGGKECHGKIKSAHSIQNNRILNRISEDGHVYTIELTVTENGPEPYFKKISRNKASTFFGFCDYHDTQIFKPIEIVSYENNPKQNFLFAYRGFCVAHHKVVRKMSTLRNTSKKFPKSLLDPQTINVYRTTQMDLRDGKEQLEKFTEDLLKSNYDQLVTFSYTLDYEVNFAVSSCLAIEKDMEMKPLQDIYDLHEDVLVPTVFINIFPIENKTVIILSYYEDSENIYGVLLEQLKNSNEQDLLNYLSYVIFNGTEDVYYRPSSIEALELRTKKSMLESYTSFLNPFIELDLLLRGLHFDFNIFDL